MCADAMNPSSLNRVSQQGATGCSCVSAVATVFPAGSRISHDTVAGATSPMILDTSRHFNRSELSLQRNADDAFPRRQVERIGLRQPHVPVDSCALVEPPVAKGRVHARHDAVFGSDGEEVGDVEAEWRVAVVVAADEAPVHKDEHVAERSIELDGDAAACVARGNVEFVPVPPHAGLRIAPPQRLVSVRHQRVVPSKRQLDRPVVGQVQRAPLRVVVTHAGKFEIAGLGEVPLTISETEIPGWVGAVAELELPAEVEEQLFAWSNGGGTGLGATPESGRCAPTPTAPEETKLKALIRMRAGCGER